MTVMPCSQCLDEPCSCVRGGRARFERDTGLKARPVRCPRCGSSRLDVDDMRAKGLDCPNEGCPL